MIHLTHEQIAKRAYEIYLRSGSLPGRDQENWLAAETELKREIETAKAHAAPKPNGHSSVTAKPLVVPPVAPAVTVTSHVSAPACGCAPAAAPAPAPKAKAAKPRKAKSRF